MNHSIRTSLRVAAFAMCVGSDAAATIEIQGNVTQTAELKNSPTTGLAIGPMARATSMLTILGGDGRQLAVVNAGTGMCLVTMGRTKPLSQPGPCCRVVGPRTMFESSVRPEE